MNLAAEEVLNQLPDIFLAYGQSDEYSFLLHPSCELYERRSSKLVSTVVSIFSTAYAMYWPICLPDTPMTRPFPSFDGRAVVYPSLKNIRDYLCWRQVDCHINNLYNTTFWTLVEKGGMARPAAEKELSGTFAADKNEILYARFGINYNEEPAIFRKGSVIFRDYVIENAPADEATDSAESISTDEATGTASRLDPDVEPDSPVSRPPEELPGRTKVKPKMRLTTAHIDIMKDDFWKQHPWLLEAGSARKRVVKKFFEDAAASGQG